MDLQQMLEQYRDIKQELAFGLEQMRTLERDIREHVRDTGEVAEVDGARIKWRKSAVRVTWDGKGLEAYAAENPAVLQFRQEKEAAAAVIIEVD